MLALWDVIVITPCIIIIVQCVLSDGAIAIAPLYCNSDRKAVDLGTLKSAVRNPFAPLGT